MQTITIGSVWNAYRWASGLYRLANTWTEKFSLTQFLIKFVLSRRVSKQSSKNDTALTLQGITYIVGLQSTEIYTIQELYTDRDYDQINDFIPKYGWTVLDIGANVGMFAMKQAYCGAYVYAFEPNQDCYRRLSRAIVENKLGSNISALNYAVGTAPGTGRMRLRDGQTTAGSVVATTSHDATQDLTVKITSLDLMIPALTVTHIDLLKIDVEGAEVEVLLGASHTLKLVDRIILEYHSAELLQQVSATLNDHGFIQTLQVDRDSKACVGVLYAKRTVRPS